MNDHRFPLPVDYTRTRRVVSLPFALLCGALLFALGFTTAVYSVGFICTAP